MFRRATFKEELEAQYLMQDKKLSKISTSHKVQRNFMYFVKKLVQTKHVM